jgi:molecular chaperone GrpE
MSTKTHENKDLKTPHPGHPDQAKHPAAPPPDTPAAGATAPAPAAETDTLKAKVSELEAELAGYKDKYIRLAAEFDNYKKRMSRQFEIAVRSANDDLIQQIIPILDNFERAFEAAKASADLAPFHQGMEMIYRQFGEILQRLGVQVIATVGKEFNPHVHEAIQTMNETGQPAHTVLQEVQKGYTLNDRVLRAAKVIVNQ